MHNYEKYDFNLGKKHTANNYGCSITPLVQKKW